MTSSAALDGLDYARLAVVAVFLLYSIYAMFVIVLNRKLVFNALWVARLFIVFLSFVWILSLLIGLSIFWTTGSDEGIVAVSRSDLENLCKAHVLITFGFAEASFFLSVFFLMVIRGSKASLKIMIWTVVSTLPLALLVVVVFIVSDVSDVSNLGFQVYNASEAVCQIPLVPLGGLFVYIVVFLFLFVAGARRLSRTLKSIHLRKRMHSIWLMYMVFLPAGVLCQGASTVFPDDAIRTRALDVAYCFISVLIASITIWIFMLLPIFDSRQAVKNIKDIPLIPASASTNFKIPKSDDACTGSPPDDEQMQHHAQIPSPTHQQRSLHSDFDDLSKIPADSNV
eukprot:ANDGO_07104.mRNA.1 hypothetical protein DDB_G0286809